jgi:hypothetical protein
MMQISSTYKPGWLTPRTASYLAAVVRDGENFDYCRWLEQVREKEAQAKELRQASAERTLSEELGVAVSTFHGLETSPNRRLYNGHAPIPIRMIRSPRKTLHSPSGARIKWRLEQIRSAWNAFQANHARDAVYGYLEAVFAIVQHYKVRRKTNQLLRQALKCAHFPYEKTADTFAVVIRCTCGDAADNKTISKWARALRYVARYKAPSTQLRTFMKQAGGVNACADRYAKYVGGGAK